MEQIKLDVQVRGEKEVGRQNIRGLRRDNFFPAIVYGGSKKPTAIKVNRKTYESIMRHHRGEHVIFQLNILEGEKKLRDYSAIVKEEQHDPVTDKILHIDFNRISLTEKIELKVGIIGKGEPIGVKRDSGVLEHVLWELDIVCLPTQIPQHLEVDISSLEIGKHITVKEIKLPEGVTTKHDMESIVFAVSAPMKEEELVAPVEGAPTEPEVMKEKKKEEKAGAAPGKEEAKEQKEEKPQKQEK